MPDNVEGPLPLKMSDKAKNSRLLKRLENTERLIVAQEKRLSVLEKMAGIKK